MKLPSARRFKNLAPACLMLSLLNGCSEPPPEAPKTVEMPQLGKPGSRVEYLVQVAIKKTNGEQLYSDKHAKVTNLEFRLTLDAQLRPDGQLMLVGNIPHVVFRENLQTMLYTLDTREPVTSMEDTSDGEYRLTHPGLKSPDHPLNGALQIYKQLTLQPFQIRLNPNGSFAQLENYPSLDFLYPSLNEVNDETGPQQERRLIDMLDVLAPQNAELLLCLLLPSREQELAGDATEWQDNCPINGTSETLTFKSNNTYDYWSDGLRYGTSKYLIEQDRSYRLKYLGVLGDWLQTAKLSMARTSSKTFRIPEIGNKTIVNTVTSEVTITDMAKGPLYGGEYRMSNSSNRTPTLNAQH